MGVPSGMRVPSTSRNSNGRVAGADMTQEASPHPANGYLHALAPRPFVAPVLPAVGTHAPLTATTAGRRRDSSHRALSASAALSCPDQATRTTFHPQPRSSRVFVDTFTYCRRHRR